MQMTEARWHAATLSPARQAEPFIALHPDDARHNDGLLGFYRREGGVVTGDQLALMLVDRVDQPISRVARWIVDRRLVCLNRGAQLLLPLFQFDLAQACIRPAVDAAVPLLRTWLDDAGIARWFAVTNAQLEHRAPAQAIRAGAVSVQQAARQLGGQRAL